MEKKETNIPKTAQILFTLPIDLLREFGAVCEKYKLSVDEGCEEAFYTWIAVISTNKEPRAMIAKNGERLVQDYIDSRDADLEDDNAF